MSKLITDKNDTIDTYIAECEEILKEMEHSDMEYPSYLIHFNPRHNPKTGRFDFAIGGPKKDYYDGQKKSDYKKQMADKYREEGYGKLKSKGLAKAASEMNEMHVRSYNRNLKANQKYADKLRTAKTEGDTKNIEKYNKKIRQTYKNAAIDAELLSKNYELGKAFYRQKVNQALFGLAGNVATTYGEGGYAQYYNDAKKLVEDSMMIEISKLKKD